MFSVAQAPYLIRNQTKITKKKQKVSQVLKYKFRADRLDYMAKMV